MSYKQYLPWAFRGAVLLVVILLAKAWNDAHSAEARLSKELERERIEKAGLLASHEASKKDLKDLEGKLLKENGDLAEEAKKLKSALDEKPKIVEVIKWRTKEVPVEVPGESRPCPTPGEDGKTAKILLVEGDTGHVEVSELTYETRAGNNVVLGKAVCMRDQPSPLKLFSGVIEAPLSTSLKTPEPEPYRWGAGVYASVTPGLDLVLGPSLAFPPAHFLWLQWEPTVSLGFTTTGKVQPAAQLVVRWR